MNIEIKYFYGDKVYFLNDNYPTAGLVRCAEVLGCRDLPKICYRVRFIDIKGQDYEQRFDSDEIFDSVEDLKNSAFSYTIDNTVHVDLDA